MDKITKQQRSLNMSKIKSKDTKPETLVRKVLRDLGFRYRLHSSSLPGKPDIYIPKYKAALFIHGCFWHQHENCKRKSMPKSNIEYWKPKLEKNVERFKMQSKELRNQGYSIILVWECKIKNLEQLRINLTAELKKLIMKNN